MTNTNYLIHSMPVAPLKLIALPGCEDMAKTIDHFLVQFRQEIVEANPSKEKLYGYAEKTFLAD